MTLVRSPLDSVAGASGGAEEGAGAFASLLVNGLLRTFDSRLVLENMRRELGVAARPAAPPRILPREYPPSLVKCKREYAPSLVILQGNALLPL